MVARMLTAVGCLFFSMLVKRSFRDTLVVLFRTTFWEAAALILKDFDCRVSGFCVGREMPQS